MSPSRRLVPIYVACGSVLGVLLAYLLAGGASYKPLEAADPCEPRSLEVLAERGTLEAVALSALDGAACELQVTREELLAALADEAALAEFSAEHDIDDGEVDAAVRAGLVRAVDDAELAGLLSGPVASIARALAQNAPIPVVIDLFQAIPGEPSLAEVIARVTELGLDLDALGDLGIDDLGAQLDELLPDDLGGLLPDGGIPGLPEDLDLGEVLPNGLPELPEELRGLGPEELQQLEDLLPGG